MQVVPGQQQGRMTAGVGAVVGWLRALWAEEMTQLLTPPSSGCWKDRWGSEAGNTRWGLGYRVVGVVLGWTWGSRGRTNGESRIDFEGRADITG